MNLLSYHMQFANKLSCSTYFRMNYLSKQITGLLTKTSQLFSGRVIIQFGFISSLTLLI